MVVQCDVILSDLRTNGLYVEKHSTNVGTLAMIFTLTLLSIAFILDVRTLGVNRVTITILGSPTDHL